MYEYRYEYKVTKVLGGGLFKAGFIDDKKTQEQLDTMSRDGWRLVTSAMELQNGNSMNLTFVWERQKQ